MRAVIHVLHGLEVEVVEVLPFVVVVDEPRVGAVLVVVGGEAHGVEYVGQCLLAFDNHGVEVVFGKVEERMAVGTHAHVVCLKHGDTEVVVFAVKGDYRRFVFGHVGRDGESGFGVFPFAYLGPCGAVNADGEHDVYGAVHV